MVDCLVKVRPIKDHNNFSFFFTNLCAQFTDYFSCRKNPVTVFINHLYLPAEFPMWCLPDVFQECPEIDPFSLLHHQQDLEQPGFSATYLQ